MANPVADALAATALELMYPANSKDSTGRVSAQPSQTPRTGDAGGTVTHEGFDLLRLPAIRALVSWGGFPYVFQFVFLAVFLLLAILAWGVFAPDGVEAKSFAKTHATTLLIWGLWWPAVLWTAVVLGRAWCLVCPLELVSNAAPRCVHPADARTRPTASSNVSTENGLVSVHFAPSFPAILR